MCTGIRFGTECTFTIQTEVCGTITGNSSVVPLMLKGKVGKARNFVNNTSSVDSNNCLTNAIMVKRTCKEFKC